MVGGDEAADLGLSECARWRCRAAGGGALAGVERVSSSETTLAFRTPCSSSVASSEGERRSNEDDGSRFCGGCEGAKSAL